MLDSQRVFLVFSTGGKITALPLENVERIVPMAQLTRPPGLPSAVEGILNLRGTAVPVLGLDRLLRLPVQPAGLYSVLIILKNPAEGRLALLVARVSEAVAISQYELLPIDQRDTFNGCAEASFLLRGQTVPLLSPQRILLEKETQALSEFHMLAQQRIEEWGPAPR